MKNFFKRNKLVILVFVCLFIALFSLYKTVYGVTYEMLDFKFGKVNTACLNVRCGPGINYNRVGKLYKDEYIDVFAKVGNWYIVQTDSNLIGAVSSDYIEAVYDENERYSAKNTQTEIQGEAVGVGQGEVVNGISTAETTQNVKGNVDVPKDNIEVSEGEEQTLQNVLNNNSGEYANSSELTKDEQEFLNLINANRVNNGLEELKIDNEIQNLARLKAKDLVENNYFSHNSETYGNIDNMIKTFNITCEKSAENIAGNSNLTGAVEAWMNSESHKVNILSNEYNYTGVAVVESSTYGKIFVEVFVKK